MKTDPGQLAIFGGTPAFAEPLHVGRPNIGDRSALMDRIAGILDRRWFTNNGPCVQEFEARLAALAGVAHCVVLANATLGLELVARAMGLEGEVIVPSFTFVATAHALQWQGLTPVFCDVDPATHNLDPARVEALMTPRVSAIVGVHVWGRACAPEALGAIAAKHGARLIFDAAHAVGCSHGGRMIGGFGDAEVYSFHATKFINSFEGGAVLTNERALAERVKLMANFGFSGYDNVIALGTNAKMSEISAAMGLTSLESLDDIVATNHRNLKTYEQHLAAARGLRLIAYDESERNNYQYVVAEIDAVEAGIDRDDLHRILHAERVMSRRYFYPGCHSMEPYRSSGRNTPAALPATERLVSRVLSLPTGTAVGPSEIAGICSVITTVLNHAGEVRDRLRREAAIGGTAVHHG